MTQTASTDSTEINELHFEHLQRVTVAIGALSGGIAVIWDTGISSIVLFYILFPDVLDTKWDQDHRKLSMLTGWRVKSVAFKQKIR